MMEKIRFGKSIPRGLTRSEHQERKKSCLDLEIMFLVCINKKNLDIEPLVPDQCSWTFWSQFGALDAQLCSVFDHFMTIYIVQIMGRKPWIPPTRQWPPTRRVGRKPQIRQSRRAPEGNLLPLLSLPDAWFPMPDTRFSKNPRNSGFSKTPRKLSIREKLQLQDFKQFSNSKRFRKNGEVGMFKDFWEAWYFRKNSHSKYSWSSGSTKHSGKKRIQDCRGIVEKHEIQEKWQTLGCLRNSENLAFKKKTHSACSRNSGKTRHSGKVADARFSTTSGKRNIKEKRQMQDFQRILENHDFFKEPYEKSPGRDEREERRKRGERREEKEEDREERI